MRLPVCVLDENFAAVTPPRAELTAIAILRVRLVITELDPR